MSHRIVNSYKPFGEEVEILEDRYYAVIDYLSEEVRSFVSPGAFYSMLMEPRVRDRLLELLQKDVRERLNTRFPLGAMKELEAQLSIVMLRVRPDPLYKVIDEFTAFCRRYQMSYLAGENHRNETLLLAGDLLSSRELDLSKVHTLVECGEDLARSYLESEPRTRSLMASDYDQLINMLNRLEALLMLAEIETVKGVTS